MPNQTTVVAFLIMVLVNASSGAITKPIELENDLTVKKESLGEDLEQFFKDQAHLYEGYVGPQAGGQSVGSSSNDSGSSNKFPGMEQLTALYELATIFTRPDLPFSINPADAVETIASLSMGAMSLFMETFGARDSPKNQTLNLQTII